MLEDKLRKAPVVLKENLDTVARVSEWSRLVKIHPTKKFSRYFLRYYRIRPQKAMNVIRLKSIVVELKKKEKSNFEIAIAHSISDEIALNKFIKYHFGCSPTKLRALPTHLINNKLEKFGSNLW